MYQEQLDVREFHLAMGQTDPIRPTENPGDAVVRLRGRLIAEECFEVLEGLFDSSYIRSMKLVLLEECRTAKIAVNLPEVADGIADLKYVLEGTNLAFGIDGEPVWRTVHAANMTKLGGGRDAHGKFLKPAGWTPPDIGSVLVAQGWVRAIVQEDGPPEPFPMLKGDSE